MLVQPNLLPGQQVSAARKLASIARLIRGGFGRPDLGQLREFGLDPWFLENREWKKADLRANVAGYLEGLVRCLENDGVQIVPAQIASFDKPLTEDGNQLGGFVEAEPGVPVECLGVHF